MFRIFWQHMAIFFNNLPSNWRACVLYVDEDVFGIIYFYLMSHQIGCSFYAACPATSVFYVWAECRRIWQKLITPTNPFDGRDHTLSDRGVFHQIGVVMLASPCKKANNQIEKSKISEGTKQEMLKIKMMTDCMSG